MNFNPNGSKFYENFRFSDWESNNPPNQLPFYIMIDRYYIDENNVLHTFKGDEKYITFENITSDEQAQTIIDGLNGEDERAFYLLEAHFID